MHLTVDFLIFLISGQMRGLPVKGTEIIAETPVIHEILLPKNFPIYFPIPNIEHSKTVSFSAKMQKKSKSEPVFAQNLPFLAGGSWIRKVRNSDCSPQAQSRHQRMTESEPVMYTQKCPQNEQKTLKIACFSHFSISSPQSLPNRLTSKKLRLPFHKVSS